MNGVLEVRQRLVRTVADAVGKAQQAGKLPPLTLPDITLEHPPNSSHGDYASSLPLKLCRATGMNPLVIARDLAGLMTPGPEIAGIAVAPPGFINFTLSNDWLGHQVETILQAGNTFGDSQTGGGARVQIEFVSVNPTGPLHVGHGRGAVLGSSLANVLAAAGHRVQREYYNNDAGAQIRAFFASLYARYRQSFGQPAEIPPNGYHGAYLVDLAGEIVAETGDRFLSLPEERAVDELGSIGLSKMVDKIRADLELLGVTFDNWFSEKSLYREGQYEKAMGLLRQGNYLVEKEGATWFESTALGEDKDNVVVRGDGSPTYFAADIAYHYNKFVERRFDKVINIWGADHQGHVSRMKAVIGALGVSPDRLKVIISQMVTLRRGNEMVKLSKRSGDIITLREVIDEVGADACRFIFLCRSADAQMDFDLELAKKQSMDNPVYYVQYAHARIASILRHARENRIEFSGGDVGLLASEPEMALVRKMVLLPEVIEVITQTLEPHHLAYYAQELATVFHQFYKQCRVVTDDVPLTGARLKLVLAAKVALAKTLGLMGITAREQM